VLGVVPSEMTVSYEIIQSRLVYVPGTGNAGYGILLDEYEFVPCLKQCTKCLIFSGQSAYSFCLDHQVQGHRADLIAQDVSL